MSIDLDELQRRTGYRFREESLARQALTHRSARKENNERLEFLGDALLGFLIAEWAWREQPDASEGELTLMRTALVNRHMLFEVAVEREIGDMLELGAGEAKSGGRQRQSILADAVEALIAAIYLDGGIHACRDFVRRWFPDPGKVCPQSLRKDNKTRLQELMQAEKQVLPDYQVVRVTGSGHSQRFEVRCKLPLRDIATMGIGSSRRAAEQVAAGEALAALGRKA